MPIKVTCPKCAGVLHAPDDAGGKRGRCPTCGTVLNIPAASSSPGFPESPLTRESGMGFPAGGGGGGKRGMLDDDEPPPVTAPLPGRGSAMGGAKRPGFGSAAAAASPGTYGLADDPKKRSSRLPSQAFGADEAKKPRVPPMPVPGQSNRPFPAAGDEPLEDQGAGWKKVRGGLGWIRFGVVFLVLAALVPAGIKAYETFSKPLPDKSPGMLGVADLSQATEIRMLAPAIPLVLGALFVLLGRMKVAGAPRSSFSRGIARAASSTTLLGVGALIAAAVPVGIAIKHGELQTEFFPKDDLFGILQRFGLVGGIAALLIAEIYFVFALGRMGAALGSPVLSGRATRFSLLAGLAFLGLLSFAMGWTEYRAEILQWFAVQVQPQLDKLGNNKPVIYSAIPGAVALVVGFCYLRLVGGGRRAIRDWQEVNPVTV